MRALLLISLFAAAAFLWATLSIATHVRRARRKRRRELAAAGVDPEALLSISVVPRAVAAAAAPALEEWMPAAAFVSQTRPESTPPETAVTSAMSAAPAASWSSYAGNPLAETLNEPEIVVEKQPQAAATPLPEPIYSAPTSVSVPVSVSAPASVATPVRGEEHVFAPEAAFMPEPVTRAEPAVADAIQRLEQEVETVRTPSRSLFASFFADEPTPQPLTALAGAEPRATKQAVLGPVADEPYLLEPNFTATILAAPAEDPAAAIAQRLPVAAEPAPAPALAPVFADRKFSPRHAGDIEEQQAREGRWRAAFAAETTEESVTAASTQPAPRHPFPAETRGFPARSSSVGRHPLSALASKVERLDWGYFNKDLGDLTDPYEARRPPSSTKAPALVLPKDRASR